MGILVSFELDSDELLDLETLLMAVQMTQRLAPRQVAAIDTLTEAIDAATDPLMHFAINGGAT
jgi:hypothetical protein